VQQNGFIKTVKPHTSQSQNETVFHEVGKVRIWLDAKEWRLQTELCFRVLGLGILG